MNDHGPFIYDFAGYRLDAARRQLTRGGKPVAVLPRCLDALLLLVARRGELLDKDFLLQALWPDVVVDENSLAKLISEIRRVLGEGPREAGCIATVPRRGYRFVGEVEVSTSSAAAPAPGDDGIRALAVLPFAVLNPVAGDEALELGLADALITRLGQLRRTSLRPTSSVARYAGSAVTPAAAGRELEVDTVITGRVRRAGQTVRVSVQMIACATDTVTWAEKFDLPQADPLALEDAVAERVGGALALAVARGERPPSARRYTENNDAYEHFLRGRYLWNKRTRESMMQAVASFERAIAIDPRYALAHAGLAISWIHAGLRAAIPQSVRPREAMPKARAAAEKALAIDDSLSDAHAALGQVLVVYEWKRAQGLEQLRRAIELNPNDPNATHWHAMTLAGMGRFDESLEQLQRARAIDPLAVIVRANVGFVLYRAGRYEEAVRQLRETVAIEPGFVMSRFRLGLALEACARYQEAYEEFAAMNPTPDAPLAFAEMARMLAMMGRVDEAREVFARVLEYGRNAYVPASLVAGVHLALGEADAALDNLERAVEERATGLLWLPSDPHWASMREHPRFRRVLEVIGVP